MTRASAPLSGTHRRPGAGTRQTNDQPTETPDSPPSHEESPKCGGTPLPPLSTHALIEFRNRAVSGLVGVITLISALLPFTRRPFCRDLLAYRPRTSAAPARWGDRHLRRRDSRPGPDPPIPLLSATSQPSSDRPQLLPRRAISRDPARPLPPPGRMEGAALRRGHYHAAGLGDVIALSQLATGRGGGAGGQRGSATGARHRRGKPA